MNRPDKRSGFTIVEVTIAMSFIAVLVITLLLVGMQIAALYNKGITIRDVNSASRSVVRSIQDDISSAPSRMTVSYYEKKSDGTLGTELKVASNLDEATTNNVHYYNNPEHGGRLCTGSYTYVWNYRKKYIEYNTGSVNNATGQLVADAGKSSGAQYYKPSGSSKFEPVRLLKFKDEQRELCNYNQILARDSKYSTDEYKNGLRIPEDFADKAVSVLGSSERGLILYNFKVTSPSNLANASGSSGSGSLVDEAATRFYSSFYNVNMTLGSSLFEEEYIGSIADKDVESHSCGDGGNSRDVYSEYCALNNIEFVARTGSV